MSIKSVWAKALADLLAALGPAHLLLGVGGVPLGFLTPSKFAFVAVERQLPSLHVQHCLIEPFQTLFSRAE